MAAICPIHFDIGSQRESGRTLYSRVASQLQRRSHFHVGFEFTTPQLRVSFRDEELKRQELFRRAEMVAAHGTPGGHRFSPDANEVACALAGGAKGNLR